MDFTLLDISYKDKNGFYIDIIGYTNNEKKVSKSLFHFGIGKYYIFIHGLFFNWLHLEL